MAFKVFIKRKFPKDKDREKELLSRALTSY
jgi:hypothetical protein